MAYHIDFTSYCKLQLAQCREFLPEAAERLAVQEALTPPFSNASVIGFFNAKLAES
jgi:hypothetical protein